MKFTYLHKFVNLVELTNKSQIDKEYIMTEVSIENMDCSCPHCGKELQLRTYVSHNVASYGGHAVGTTVCCGKPVTVRRIITFDITPYHGNKRCDDWGVPFVY